MIALQSLKTTQDGQICTFLLPQSYKIPIHLARATQDEWVLAFHIADQVLASKERFSNQEFSSSIAKELTKDHELSVEKLLSQHKKDLERQESQYQTELKGLERTLHNKETAFSKQIADLQASLEKASASYEKIRDQFLEEAERRVLQQKQSDTQIIDLLKSELELQRNENKSLKERVESKITIQQNSTKKGKEGEEHFEQIVKQKMGWNLIYQGDKGHAADYQMNLYSINIRFEVKNYTDVVKTKEVEKLRVDLREHPETDVGVFVSLNTGITGLSGISLEWTPTNQLILYIPYFLQQDMDMILHFVDIVFQTVKPYRCILAETVEKDEFPVYKDRIDRALVYAQNGITRIISAMAQFTKDIKALQDKIEDMTSHTKTNLAAQKEELQSMIAILTGKNVEAEEAEEPEALPAVHEEKKKGGRKKKEVSKD